MLLDNPLSKRINNTKAKLNSLMKIIFQLKIKYIQMIIKNKLIILQLIILNNNQK